MKLSDLEKEQGDRKEIIGPLVKLTPRTYCSAGNVKSYVCYIGGHKSEDCPYAECQCECHKAETKGESLVRAFLSRYN